MRGKSTERLVLGSLFAALTAVCAQVVIPVGAIPVSLSLLPVLLCGALLRPWDTAAAMGAYVLMGLIGLPVFSNLEGGVGKLLGPTGGYIIGYIPCALLISLILRQGRAFPRIFLAMACGVLACYTTGTVWFCVSAGQTPLSALTVCVLPFLPFDTVKIALAAILGQRFEKAGIRA